MSVKSYLEVEEGGEGPDGDTAAQGEAVVVGGQSDREVLPQALVQGADRHQGSADHGVDPPVLQLQVERGADVLLPVLGAGVAVVQLAEVAAGTTSRVQPVEHLGSCQL